MDDHDFCSCLADRMATWPNQRRQTQRRSEKRDFPLPLLHSSVCSPPPRSIVAAEVGRGGEERSAMAAVWDFLREVKESLSPGRDKGQVIRDMEYAMRTKGGMTREEEIRLHTISSIPKGGLILGAAWGTFVGWLGLGIGRKFVGLPPLHGLTRFGLCSVTAFVVGKVTHYQAVEFSAILALNVGGERMKTELASIILNKYTDDRVLLKAVKRLYFAEHLFNDMHQDRPLFRWHPRHTYTDSAFVERVNEIDASNSDDQTKSISGQTTASIRSFGDLMEDPLACVLGSPAGGDMESNIPSESIRTVPKRSELRSHRRSRRRHHQNPENFAAM